ncbi:MAG TPA: amidohydrolase family protein [Gaiellaceae bacterium]|nr:amidohydrolase family protein [Gaiellaceae bacterium]
MEITNCHVHTFTQAHTPNRFLPWPVAELARIPLVRRMLGWIARLFDPQRTTALGRYAQIIETSYKKTQGEVFEIVRGFYPEGTRFVVLPMDMTKMNAGTVAVGIEEQHAQVAALRNAHPDSTVIPFAAVDPRHDGIVEKTIALLEQKHFRGLKLYPPTGYHPYDHRLWPLYEYAEKHSLPVLTHCSRPASVQYRGEPTVEMRTDPVTGELLNLGRFELLARFTDPDAYVPVFEKYPNLRICLAHFGGAGDWRSYLDRPWHSGTDPAQKSWLAKILDMFRCGKYPNLWTDISYTLYANDENVYLLKVLLSDPRVSTRVLFGSDFYVVENAELEERRRSVRIRAVLGEEAFNTLAQENPRRFLGETPI